MKYWWRVRRYFRFPEIDIIFRKDDIDFYCYKSRLVYKTKWDEADYRVEFLPTIFIALFNLRISIILGSDIYWETILKFLYYSKKFWLKDALHQALESSHWFDGKGYSKNAYNLGYLTNKGIKLLWD